MKRTEQIDVRVYIERMVKNESRSKGEGWNGFKRNTGKRGTE